MQFSTSKQRPKTAKNRHTPTKQARNMTVTSTKKNAMVQFDLAQNNAERDIEYAEMYGRPPSRFQNQDLLEVQNLN